MGVGVCFFFFPPSCETFYAIGCALEQSYLPSCVPKAAWIAEHLESCVLWVCNPADSFRTENLQLTVHRMLIAN